MEGHPVRHRVAGQGEGKLVAASGEYERSAGAKVYLLEMKRVAEGGEHRPGEVVVTHARPAGDQQQVVRRKGRDGGLRGGGIVADVGVADEFGAVPGQQGS